MTAWDTHRELRPALNADSGEGGQREGLPVIPHGWIETEIRLKKRVFRLLVPSVPDGLLDSLEVLSANAKDDYMPYWAYLWPAAMHLSESILEHQWPKNTRILELGCGLGLVGIAALAAGCEVVMTDYDVRATQAARKNAEINGFANSQVAVFDWRQPLEDQYAVIVGCDVTYERRNHAPILDLLDRMLEADGMCWLADGGRNAAPDFVNSAKHRGFSVQLRDMSGSEVHETGLNYVLMEIRKTVDVLE